MATTNFTFGFGFYCYYYYCSVVFCSTNRSVGMGGVVFFFPFFLEMQIFDRSTHLGKRGRGEKKNRHTLFVCAYKMMTMTLTLSVVPFLRAWIRSFLAIESASVSPVMRSIASWSVQTSHSCEDHKRARKEDHTLLIIAKLLLSSLLLLFFFL